MPFVFPAGQNPGVTTLKAFLLGIALCACRADEVSVDLPAGVKPVWDLSLAYRETTLSGERTCINGLWRWQPANDESLPTNHWGYFKVPASWPGIYFNPSSKNNIINYAVIKNAYQAVVVQNPSLNANPKLTIAETIIDNAYDVGLLGINTKITGQNLLISNCDKNLVLVNGGNYQFTHCTVASYSNGFMVHEEPVLLLSDYLESSQNHLDVLFRNCIFWGEEGIVETEIRIEKKGSPSIKFDNVIWKVKENPVTPTGNSFNQDPLFDSINVERNFYDFHLQESSKGINNGGNTSITLDLDGKPRPVGLPDLGCYERN